MNASLYFACFCAAAGCAAPEQALVATRGSTNSEAGSASVAVAGAMAPAMAPPPTDANPIMGTAPVIPTAPATMSRDDDCSAAAKLVYVLDQSAKLSSFRPDTSQFTDIGTLACESASRPYSMSVDRRGTAWVVYESGQLYKVSTTDAHCEAVARAPGTGGFSTFGMSFVALAGQAGQAAKDQLFIAGMRPLDASFNFQAALGTIDTGSLATDRVGMLEGVSPELTGTGDGKLWVFLPTSRPPRLDRLDPKSAATMETHALTSIESGNPRAWAVAFWGGDFWVFLQLAAAPSTVVHRIDGKTFTSTVSIANTGRSIVGAGVSTCAPLTLF